MKSQRSALPGAWKRTGLAKASLAVLVFVGSAWAQSTGSITSQPANSGATPQMVPGISAPSSPGTSGLQGSTTRSPVGNFAQPGGTPDIPASEIPVLRGHTGPKAEGPASGEQQKNKDKEGVAKARAVLEAEPFSEFQRFVAEATGHRLGRFGATLFASQSATFAPVDRVPVPADYVLGPGDELLVRAWGGVDMEVRATVDRNGLISLPRVGSVRVAGIKAAEIESYLNQQVGRVFSNFQLNVTLGQLRSIQVFVVGHAQRPGQYTVSSLSTLMNAVFASGGPNINGSMRRIQLKRGEKVVTELDLYRFLLGGDLSADRPLLPGDTIVYRPTGPQVALMGATDSPAIYELRDERETLADLLRYSGGLSAVTTLHQAQVERVDVSRPKAPRQVAVVSLDAQGRSLALRDGDMVTLFQVAPEFANAVTLRGNVAAPLRHPHHAGMRISDLIPDPDALLTADYHIRKNRLVQYLGGAPGATATTRNLVDEPNWDYAVIERLDRQSLQMRLIPFNLRRAVMDRDPTHDLPLQPGDVVTIYGAHDVALPQSARMRLVRVEGEVRHPGVYQLQPGETLRQLLTRAGGFTEQAYLYGLELQRESTRRKQREAIEDAARRLEALLASESSALVANLSSTDAQAAARLQAAQMEARQAQLVRLRNLQPNGRIALDVSEDIAKLAELPDALLEDGDRIYVPSRPGFVFLAGSVANSNALLWQPERTLGDYLKAAGLEPGADEDNVFVVRANGMVMHRRDAGLFAFDSARLMPGDVVIVPEKLDRESAWSVVVRGLKDWSQILYQLGLAAVAVDTLRR